MKYDKRTTSQRVTDAMNAMRDEISAMKKEIRWYRNRLKRIDVFGPITENNAYEMRRWAREALDMYKDR